MSHLPVAGFCRGGRVKLAETCQAGNSTPRFLAAQRSAVSSRREEVAFVALAAQHNTRVCGPLCDPSGSSQAMPSLSGASTVLPALSFWIAIANRFAAHSTIKLPSSKPTVFRRRKAFLLCKNPCGDCGGDGVPAAVRDAPPAQRNFQRKFALRRVGSSKSIVPPTIERSKVRNNARLEKFLYRAAPGCRGTAVPLFREESRGTPFKGFLWATSSRRLDTALLFADKKRGVETYQAGRALPVSPWSSDHGSSHPPAAGRQQKSPLTPRRAQKRTCLAAGPFLFPNYSSSSPAGASSARMDSEIRLCS